METTEKEEKKPTAAELAEARLPEPLTKGEREILEGQIIELREENQALKNEIAELKKPEPTPRKKSGKDVLDDWIPKII